MVGHFLIWAITDNPHNASPGDISSIFGLRLWAYEIIAR
jgi:hypothetical protein